MNAMNNNPVLDPFLHVYNECCQQSSQYSPNALLLSSSSLSALSQSQIQALSDFLDDNMTGLEILVLKCSIASVAKDKDSRCQQMIKLTIATAVSRSSSSSRKQPKKQRAE
ncbi:hypothetical protein ACA910_012535 [Epithemia clementina (nom. ined.)]